MTFSLFTINIYRTKLNLDNKRMINYLNNIKKTNKGVNKSNPEGTGWQSDFLNLNDFVDLQEQIKPHVIKYMNDLSLKGIAKMNSLWANFNNYKDYNEVHTHGESPLSTVYYLKKPKNSGDLFFDSPIHSMNVSWSNFRNVFNTGNISRVTFNVEENDLFIFPGWLPHGVKPNLNKKETRISLASNIYLGKK